MKINARYLGFVTMAALLIVLSCDDDDDNGGGMNTDNEFTLDLVADGLFSPLVFIEAPDNTDRQFIVDQAGQIYIFTDSAMVETPFLDISDRVVVEGEKGLLGLAFHPDFASNGRFFLYYSGPLSPAGPEGWDHTNYVSEFTVAPGEDVADPASEVVLLAMDHPQGNHNAGMLAFGPDGYLYISVGDGGGGNDNGPGHVEDGNGQDITQNLLGSILRIDVNTPGTYQIPSDNPFVGSDGLDEIFAYGLRNPYRFSFAPEGNIIVADAGQELYEEINVVEAGGNYGWNIKEGMHCFDPNNPTSPPDSCATTGANGEPLIDPVIEFGNSKSLSDGLGNVSIGGYVYEGDDVPSLFGKYIFGVLTQDPSGMNGAVFAAERSGTAWNYDKLQIGNMPSGDLDEFVVGFGKDDDGEVYVLTNRGTAGSGKVYKLNGSTE
jgi:glucose/arabinose dehydrogenase